VVNLYAGDIRRRVSWVDGVVLSLSVSLATASIYLRLSGYGELLLRL